MPDHTHIVLRPFGGALDKLGPQPSLDRQRRWAPVFAGALLLSACGSEAKETVASPAPNESVQSAKAATPQPAARQAKAVAIHEDSELVSFAYRYPAEAASVPAIDRRLREDAARHLRQMRETAVAEREARADMAIDFNPLGFEAEWTTMGQSGPLLSLAAKIYAYTGGAHGNAHYDSIVWDRQTGEALGPFGLFGNEAAAREMLKDAYCPRLDALRAERREETLPLQGEGWLVECPTLDNRAIVPVDTNEDGRFDTLRILLPPYEAGSYAEGTYEVDVAMNAALIALLKPDYRGAFEG